MDGQRNGLLSHWGGPGPSVAQAAPATALPFAALPAARGGLNVIFVFSFSTEKRLIFRGQNEVEAKIFSLTLSVLFLPILSLLVTSDRLLVDG